MIHKEIKKAEQELIVANKELVFLKQGEREASCRTDNCKRAGRAERSIKDCIFSKYVSRNKDTDERCTGLCQFIERGRS